MHTLKTFARLKTGEGGYCAGGFRWQDGQLPPGKEDPGMKKRREMARREETRSVLKTGTTSGFRKSSRGGGMPLRTAGHRGKATGRKKASDNGQKGDLHIRENEGNQEE